MYNEHDTLVTEIDRNIEKLMLIKSQIQVQEEYYTELKALYAAKLIKESNLLTIVEIGVYRGAFILPIAAYLKDKENAKCYGVDPYVTYTQEDSEYPIKHGTITNYETEQNELGTIYKDVFDLIQKYELPCSILREKSEETISKFEDGEIDLLHLDASYLYKEVKWNLENYFPKIKVGGYIICNGTNRESVYKAYKGFITLNKAQICVVNKTWEFCVIQKLA
jgi:hypothetical protein